MRVVLDYVAIMTERQVINEHKALSGYLQVVVLAYASRRESLSGKDIRFRRRMQRADASLLGLKSTRQNFLVVD